MPLVAGVDSSTQSTKVEIRDADNGELVSTGRHPHQPVSPPVAEQHPDEWWAAFQGALESALVDARRRVADPSISAIAVAGQQHGCVVLDARFDVIRPAKLWCDTTTAADAEWLRGRLAGGDAAWAQACGSVLVASHTITKLSWLHRSEPEGWARLAHVCLPHDWLTFRLGGELVTDRGDASGTGWWSPSAERYRIDLLEIVDGGLDWVGMLPRVAGPVEAIGEWDGALVGPGTGDNMAAALGLGLGPGDVSISIGTSGVVSTVSEAPTADPTGAVAGFADATGLYLPLVCTLNAAKVTDAFARLLGVDNEGLDELATASAPGAGGLTLLPYLDGERTPNRPDATGLLAGLRSDMAREQIARAAVEGVVCGLLDGLDALGHHVAVDGETLVLTGGGASSSAYRRVTADLAGRSVTFRPGVEAAAAGACLQAAAVLHQRAPQDVHSVWSDAGAFGEAVTVEPDGDGSRADRAAEIRARYARLRDASSPV